MDGCLRYYTLRRDARVISWSWKCHGALDGVNLKGAGLPASLTSLDSGRGACPHVSRSHASLESRSQAKHEMAKEGHDR